MRIILLTLLLNPSFAQADLKDWLKAFCEKHIVSDDPYLEAEVKELYESLQTSDLIKSYRSLGAQVYWLSIKVDRTPMQSETLRMHRRTMRGLGLELRERNDYDALLALDDYQKYEKDLK